jgi:hypothetical protein
MRVVLETGSWEGDEGEGVVMHRGLCPKVTRLIMSSLWMGAFISMERCWTMGIGLGKNKYQ